MKHLLLMSLILMHSISYASTTKHGKTKEAPARKTAAIQSTNDQESLVPTFVNFLACKNSNDPVKTLECVSALTISENTKSLHRWLYLPVSIQEIRTCAEKEALTSSQGFEEQTPLAVCFKISDQGKLRKGIAFFKKESGKVKLYSLFAVR